MRTRTIRCSRSDTGSRSNRNSRSSSSSIHSIDNAHSPSLETSMEFPKFDNSRVCSSSTGSSENELEDWELPSSEDEDNTDSNDWDIRRRNLLPFWKAKSATAISDNNIMTSETTLDPNNLEHPLEVKEAETGSIESNDSNNKRKTHSVAQPNFMDEISSFWIKVTGAVVSVQCLTQLVQTNKIASLFLDDDTLEALSTIRSIFSTVQSNHGVETDIFRRYKKSDMAISILALSRLQHVSQYYKWGQKNTTSINTDSVKQDSNNNNNNNKNESAVDLVQAEPNLIRDLSHYSIYANAAYGWKMDFAIRQKIHLGGNNQALIHRTGVTDDDILAVQWESKAHRPAYFCVREPERKAIVLCIRGTWTVHDILTDLCCASEDLTVFHDNEKENDRSGPNGNKQETRKGHTIRAHQGMLKAAKLVQEDVQDILEKEFLHLGSEYSLILVGHSMGGCVAAILGNLLGQNFPERQIRVYAYGPACVFPIQYQNLGCTVVSVVADRDPFRCISIGHVADISTALSKLCEDPLLLNEVLLRTNLPPNQMTISDLQWCCEVMDEIRDSMKAEKLYPPGRILLIGETTIVDHEQQQYPSIRDVQSGMFEDLIIGTRMFDISRHLPSVYESLLKKLKKRVMNAV